MSILRRVEEKFEECIHLEVCNLRDNMVSLRKTTADLGKLMENKRFNTLVECDYYKKKKVERCES